MIGEGDRLSIAWLVILLVATVLIPIVGAWMGISEWRRARKWRRHVAEGRGLV